MRNPFRLIAFLAGASVIIKSLNLFNKRTLNLLSYQIEKVSFRTLIAERTKIEIILPFQIFNSNKESGTVIKTSGTVTFMNYEFDAFSSDISTPILAESVTNHTVSFFVDISNRNIPAIVRNIWRTSVFTGSATINGSIETSLGVIEFKQEVDIR